MCSHGRLSGSWGSPIHTGHRLIPNLSRAITKDDEYHEGQSAVGSFRWNTRMETGHLPENMFDSGIFAGFEQGNDSLKCRVTFEIRIFLQYLEKNINVIQFRIEKALLSLLWWSFITNGELGTKSTDQPEQAVLCAPELKVSASPLPPQCPTICSLQTERAMISDSTWF